MKRRVSWLWSESLVMGQGPCNSRHLGYEESDVDLLRLDAAEARAKIIIYCTLARIGSRSTSP